MAVSALQVEGLSVALGQRRILNSVKLQLSGAELLGLVGPNGSGKSTLLRCVVGLLPPSAGSVVITGYDLHAAPQQARRNLGYAPDPTLLPAGLTVAQCLQLVAQARELSAVPQASWEQVERLGFARWRDSLVGNLSLGTRQKLSIVLGLMQAPALIVLDEVFNGLDPLSAFELKCLLKELRERHGCAVLLATHGLELAADLLDSMLLLGEGRVVKHWGSEEFQALSRAGGAGLEAAIVGQLRSG